MLFLLPQGTHSWAQADRYSLAVNFYDRGMNLFLPRTHNLYATDGIVGVEFPIQSYVAAALAKVFGRQYLSLLFRLTDVIIACTGLVFLFMSCFRITRNFLFSIVPPLFIFCSPVFIFYTCNYLPDTASASVVFIAIYFILRYQDNSRVRDMIIAIGLLTLAGLIKTSAVLYLVAFAGSVLLQKIYRRNRDWKHTAAFTLACTVSASMLAGYFLYNQHLNAKYEGWIFLAQAMPFSGWNEVQDFINNSFKPRWMPEYLVLPQYLVLAVIVTTALPLLWRSLAGKKKLVFTCISLAGSLSVAWLMGKQLFEHDYYIIVIFLPLIAYWLVVSIAALHQGLESSRARLTTGLALLTASTIVFFFADHQVHQRLKRHDGIPWAEKGYALFEQLHIPKNDPILVLNEGAPNLALVYFDRRGYNLAPGNWANMGQVRAIMAGMRVRTGVCEQGLGMNLQQNDSTFNKFFKLLAAQDGIAVFKAKD